MKRQKTGLRIRTRQKGVVLAVCLIFLLIVTLIATTGMQNAVLEERMAGNMEDYSIAFQSAEAALKVGEEWLNNQTFRPVTRSGTSPNAIIFDQGSSVLEHTGDTREWWFERNAAWWVNNTNSVEHDDATRLVVGPDSFAGESLEGVGAQPRLVIEEMTITRRGQSLGIGTGEEGLDRVIHRITARGVGGNPDAVVLLQSTYIRSYE